MQHTDLFDVMNDASFVNATATGCGWARTSRDSKTMAFVELNDGTTLQFCDKPRNWKKNREKMTFIQEVISLNRN